MHPPFLLYIVSNTNDTPYYYTTSSVKKQWEAGEITPFFINRKALRNSSQGFGVIDYMRVSSSAANRAAQNAQCHRSCRRFLHLHDDSSL